MSVAASPPVPEVLRRVIRLQVFTIIWMSVEAAVSLGAAWTSRSPALLGFGGDSAIELLSAAVVCWRFRSKSNSLRTEQRAARIAGGLLFALAAYLVFASGLALLGYREAQPSLVGIVLLVLAAFVMPWLATRKRELATLTSSSSLKADAVESALCGYLAWIALAGLAANAIWGKSWADPVAALALTPIILREGWEAMHASQFGCQCSSH
jgi:divalent metal cation (Fe/Co/Zn/Cd) transporter